LSEYVADTHALDWHLAGSNRLSPAAREIMQSADRGLHRIFVPSIALVELIYLEERGAVRNDTVNRIIHLVSGTGERASYSLVPLDLGTVRALRDVPRDAVTDMPDRIIVATAKQLGLPLISRDGKIRRSGAVPIVW
jgi:PIN domain nuclease of toxin-antitoxin system